MDRNDFTAPVSYSGPPPKPPRPWFLHPAFIILVVLLLAGGGWAMKDQLRAMQLRSRGMTVEMVDGKPVVALPAKATIIGEEWQWRVIDNPEFGLKHGHEYYTEMQEINRGESGDLEYALPHAWDDYDFMFWPSIRQVDLDGDGIREFAFRTDNEKLKVFNPERGWFGIDTPAWLPQQGTGVEIDDFVWWDWNNDGRSDLIIKYLSTPEADLNNPEIETAVVFDGNSSEKLASLEADLIGDLWTGDFDGDGREDLAYLTDYSVGEGGECLVSGLGRHTVGKFNVPGGALEFTIADIDDDGQTELIGIDRDGMTHASGLGQQSSQIYQSDGTWSLIQFVEGRNGALSPLLFRNPAWNRILALSVEKSQGNAGNEDELDRLHDLVDPDLHLIKWSPQGSFRTFEHFSRLSDDQRRDIQSEIAIGSFADNSIQALPLPESYLASANPSFPEWVVHTLRLPGQKGELLCIPPANSAALLVMSLDGSFVHYEELGEIPLHSEVIKGDTHDYIMLVFEDRILVYP